MSYEPLHHKYRPQTFANLVGQEAIARTLTNAISSERIAPAYLFTGPRGTGKTSSARILAKSLNCKKQDKPTESPCGVCEVCKSIANGSALDVIEIDAASNTGVDNIREIIERAQFAPAQCRYKVYVVDECHMLSSAAFNALLKTLEEPPDRVVFVLATTDPQRVLPTIISRCQRFDFRRIPLEAMVEHLGKIAKQENISITPDAIALVAQVAQGGLRDAESLLDQLSLLPEQVTVEAVWDLVGTVPERDLLALARAIASNNPQPVIEQCRHLLDRGKEPLVVLQNLAGFYRDLLIAKTAPTRGDLVALTPQGWKQLCEFAAQLDISQILLGSQRLKDSEVQVKNTTQPRLWLEVTLLGLLPRANPEPVSTVHQPSLQPSENRREAQPRYASESKPLVSPHNAASTPTSPVSHQTDSQTADTPAPLHTSDSSRQPPPTSATNTSTNDRLQSPSPASSSSTPAADSEAVVLEASHSPVDTPLEGLEGIWQEVLAHVQPFTKGLLETQGCLLSFDGSVARISISSPGLLKLAQTKAPDIEAAFEAICKSKVKVFLQPGASQSANTAPADEEHEAVTRPSAPNSMPLGTQKAAPRGNVDPKGAGEELESASSDRNDDDFSFSPSPQPPVPPSDIPTSFAEQISGEDTLGVASLREVSSRTPIEADLGSYTTAIAQPPMSPSALEVERDVEDVDRALRELKQFFDGELVDLADEFSKRDPVITSSLQPSQVDIDAASDRLELDSEESWEEPEPIESAATPPIAPGEIAAFDNTQIRLRRENWQYDEDGDLAF